MNLQETIKKILKEETNTNIRLRRRMVALDNEFHRLMKEVYTPDNLCWHLSGEDLLEHVLQSVINFMYFKYFSNLNDDEKLWNEMYDDIIEHIKDKNGEKIIEYYHVNCGD